MKKLQDWTAVFRASLLSVTLGLGFTATTTTLAFADFDRQSKMSPVGAAYAIADLQCENESPTATHLLPDSQATIFSVIKASLPSSPFNNSYLSAPGHSASPQAAHPESIALAAVVILCISLLMRFRTENA